MARVEASAAALRALGRLLGEAITIAEPKKLGRFSSVIFLADGLPTVAVNDALTPGEQVVEILHCYAHQTLGHLNGAFRVRLEIPIERWDEQPQDRIAEDNEALRLTTDWIRGRGLPDGLRMGFPEDGAHESIAVRAQRWAHRARVSSVLSTVGFGQFVQDRFVSYEQFRRQLCAKKLAEFAGERLGEPSRGTQDPSLWAPPLAKEDALLRYREQASREDCWVDEEVDDPFDDNAPS